MKIRFSGLLPLIVLAAASAAQADIIYVAQTRSVEARTTYDDGLSIESAPAFDPFFATASRSVVVPTTSGPRTTQGTSGISCILEFNFIRATGTLQGQGAVSTEGRLERGRAEITCDLTFDITAATPFLLESPRIDACGTRGGGGDDYRLLFERIDLPQSIFASNPEGEYINQIALTGNLEPGRYRLFYSAELNGRDETARDGSYEVNFFVPAPGALSLAGAAALVGLRRRRR